MKTMIPMLIEASHTIRRLRRRNEILEAQAQVLDLIGGVMRRSDGGGYALAEFSIEERLDKMIQEFEGMPAPAAPEPRPQVNRTAPAAPGKAQKRGPYQKRVAKVPSAAAPTPPLSNKGDKPDTVVGAIKVLLRDETEPFTPELLRENLMEEAAIKKLLETPEGGRALSNALYQWTAAGRLKKDGDNYTVTAAGKEWFNK